VSERQSSSVRHHQEGTMSFSGIDQHKRDCVITTYDATSRRVKQERVPNDPRGSAPTSPLSGIASDGRRVHRVLVLAGRSVGRLRR